MSRFSPAKPAAMKMPSLIATMFFFLVTLILLGGGGFMAYRSITVLMHWEQGQGTVVSYEESKKITKRGETKTVYRPIFEVKPSGGAPLKVRCVYGYDSTSEMEIGAVLAIRYSSSEAMLDTVVSIYLLPLIPLGLSLLFGSIFYALNKGRLVAMEHNKKHGYT